MAELVRLAREEDVAVVTIENPPVNALATALLRALRR